MCVLILNGLMVALFHTSFISYFLLTGSQKKTVYIDSPLVKTEMTVRERSHIFHEESLKLSIKKNGSKNVFHLMTELPVSEQQISPVCWCINIHGPICVWCMWSYLIRTMVLCFLFLNQESSQRNCVSFENNGLDFEVDLTDLETFGETPIKTSKMPKIQNEQDVCVKSKKATSSPPLSKTKRSSEHLVNTSSSSKEEVSTSLTDMDDPITEKTTQSAVSEAIVPKTEQMRPDPAQESDEDDEKLVIDDTVSPSTTSTTQPKPKTTPCSTDPPIAPVSESVPVNSDSPSPQKVTRQRRQSKRARVSGDQLGEILRMQTAMFNSASDTAKCSTISQETNSPTRCTRASAHSHPTSLVKPCVTSYLERNQNQDGETCTAPQESTPVVNITTGHKSWCQIGFHSVDLSCVYVLN